MRAPSQEPPVKREPVQQNPMKIGSLDVEAFSHNLARLVEEGGRALAAYLKPREQGRDDSEFADEVTEVVKTLGQVAEYWLADPQRTVEVQTRLGKAYLDLWASAVKRLAGEETAPIATPAPGRQAVRRPRMDAKPVFRFPETGLSADRALGRQIGQRCRRA